MHGARTSTRRSDTGAWLVGLGVLAGVMAKLVLDNLSFLTTTIIPIGDAAADILLVQRAHRELLLVGHYNLLGVNHPGPFFLYPRYLADLVVGPFVATQFGAHLVGMMATGAAYAGLLAAMLYRLAGGGPIAAAGAVAATVMVLFEFAGEDHLATLFMPSVLAMPLLAFLIASVLLLRGSVLGLLATVVGAMALVHGYIPLAPVALVIGAGTFLLGHRARARETGAGFPAWSLLVSSGIVLAFLAPMALDAILDPPGNIAAILAKAADGGGTSGSPSRLVEFLSGKVLRVRPFLWLPVVVGFALVAVTGRHRALARDILAIAALSVLLLGIVYARVPERFHDNMAYFLIAAPLSLVAVGSLVCVVELARPRPGVAILSTAILVLGFVSLSSLARGPRHVAPEIRQLSAAIAGETPPGARVVLEIPSGAERGVGIGLLLDLGYLGVDACVPDASMAFFYTRERICGAAAANQRTYRVQWTHLDPASDPQQRLRALTPTGRAIVAALDAALRRYGVDIEARLRKPFRSETVADGKVISRPIPERAVATACIRSDRCLTVDRRD